MYDYISIHSIDYKNKVKSKDLEQYLTCDLGLIKESHLKFYKIINQVFVRVNGILARKDGSYAYDSLDGIEEINLIEIDVPSEIDHILEQELADMANAIAKNCSWIIDDDHGLE
ncbi:hypothetical protein [Paenibacillus paeoniae]|nr:hypothetical protein [Paenibacillus paeoniae]